jgi:hypothetical protein
MSAGEDVMIAPLATIVIGPGTFALNNPTPTLTGTATVGSSVTIRTDSGTALGTAIVDANGNWRFPIENPLSEGDHTFRATATNAAGSTSTARITLIIDLTPSAVPVIDQVLDAVAPITGPLKSGDYTDDPAPAISGKNATPGDTIKLYDGSTYLGSTPVNSDGTWTFKPGTDLADGAHGLQASSVDPVGNESAKSPAFNINVDTVAPTALATVTQIGKDSGTSHVDFLTNDGAEGRLMSGTLSAELTPANRLEVSTDGGATWSAALVSGTEWTAQDPNAHTASWNILTRVVSLAGRIGPVNTQAVALDTTPPPVPDAITRVSGGVQVTFDNTLVAAGDTLLVRDGDQQVAHVLTQAEVNAGSVTVNGTFSAAPTSPDSKTIYYPGTVIQTGDFLVTLTTPDDFGRITDFFNGFSGATGNSLYFSTLGLHEFEVRPATGPVSTLSFILGGMEGPSASSSAKF